MAARRLGKPLAQVLFDAFLKQIESGMWQSKHTDPPLIDLSLARSRDLPYPHLSITQTDRGNPRFGPEPSLHDIFGKDDDFDETQRQLHASATRFFDGLNGTALKDLVSEISIDDLRLLAEAKPDNLSRLIAVLEAATDPGFVWLQHVVFAAAPLISNVEPDRAISLLRRACNARGFLKIGYGDGLTSEHVAIWSCSDGELMRNFWKKRLMTSENNAVLATEVLAAERFGAGIFIQSVIAELVQSTSALDQAYGLVIAGFSSRSANYSDLILGRATYKGIVGDSARVARRAMEKQAWARQWSAAASKAETAEEFFLSQTITKTCIDARTSSDFPPESSWAIYEPLFQRLRRSGIKAQDKDREKKLLGLEAPDSLFLKCK